MARDNPSGSFDSAPVVVAKGKLSWRFAQDDRGLDGWLIETDIKG